MIEPTNRRTFLKQTLVGAGALGLAGGAPNRALLAADTAAVRKPYTGPNVIIVRFGGGVRRRETIDPEHTYSPYLCHELTKRGTLFPGMAIDSLQGVETSHGQGTLYILSGKYDKFKDVGDKFLGARFESKVPTVFEYLRKAYDVPAHQTLIVNSEDRTDEEFYTFSNHHLFGVNYRSHVLSLFRFKTYLLRRQIAGGQFEGKQLQQKQAQLRELESLDRRNTERNGQGEVIEAFWERWRRHYGETGFVNPRGDRLLTELSVRAIKELRPKLMMINYQDPDYVHWGNMSHYTRGVSIIDQGIKQLVAAVEADDAYRDNTVFLVVPDCGRDSNRFMSVPCQHHFNSKSAHDIWALAFGTGIAAGQRVDKPTDQTSIASTVGQVMGFKTPFVEGPVLQEAIA